MHKSLLNDVRHWQDRADEARAIADVLKGEDARQSMLAVADSYDTLAKLARERILTLPPNYGRGATVKDHESAGEPAVLNMNGLRCVK